MSYDFNDAKPAEYEVIPAGTRARILLKVEAGDSGTPENCFRVTKGGLWQLVLQCIVLNGQYAKRQFWQRLTMGAEKGVTLTEGQQTGIAISGTMLRSILESARGFAATDDSPAAIKARQMSSLMELNNLEVEVEIGVEKGKDGYADKNKIAKVIGVGKTGDEQVRIPSVGASHKAAIDTSKPVWAR